MDAHHADRRDVLKQMTALAAAMPIVASLRPVFARAGEAQGRSAVKTSYDPAAKFELKVSEVEFRRTPAGRQLMARIYQPQGAGPFPTLLDLHGGAWRRKDRRVRQLQRRPRRPAAGHAPARCALQRDSVARGPEPRCDGGLRGDPLADQRHVRALPAGGEDEARG